MITKKKNINVVVILMVALVVLLISLICFINQKGGSRFIVHYYKDGVEVNTETSLSVIQVETFNYDEISLDIIGENIGDYPIINMQIYDAGPVQFKDSLPTLSKSLNASETKTLWISDRIDVHQFESLSQPVKFWVNISGESPYVSGKIYDYIETDLYFETVPALIVTGLITLDGNHEYSKVTIYPGGTINVGSLGWLNITATGDIIIMGTINSRNIFSGGGNGGVGATEFWYSGQWQELAGGGGGAGHGGNGASGDSYQIASGGGGGRTYGSISDFTVYTGSRGGNGGGSRGGGGGAGSGWLQLSGKNISINGTLNFRGSNGGGGSTLSGTNGGGGGGGSAGTILIEGANVDMDDSHINLQGGVGGAGSVNAGNGGSGSGGRLKIFYKDTLSKNLILLNLGGGSEYYEKVI